MLNFKKQYRRTDNLFGEDCLGDPKGHTNDENIFQNLISKQVKTIGMKEKKQSMTHKKVFLGFITFIY